MLNIVSLYHPMAQTDLACVGNVCALPVFAIKSPLVERTLNAVSFNLSTGCGKIGAQVWAVGIRDKRLARLLAAEDCKVLSKGLDIPDAAGRELQRKGKLMANWGLLSIRDKIPRTSGYFYLILHIKDYIK
jgi:hypothetical protein